jgi:hypothetical protein
VEPGSLAVGALTEVVAAAVTAGAGRTWKAIRRDPEAKALEAAADAALVAAFAEARRDGVEGDEEWLAAVAQTWRSAFAPEVAQALVACLADAGGDGQRRFAGVAVGALGRSGCDLAELERTCWVEQFVWVLPGAAVGRAWKGGAGQRQRRA